MFRNKFCLVLVLALVLAGAGVFQASGQTKKRTSRRTTPAPTSDQVQIVSTADDDSTTGSARPRGGSQDTQPTTISGLARQVGALNQRIAQMEANQRALVDLERLSRAEQRAEALRTELFAAQDRESALQSRIDGIDLDLQPENIDNTNNLNGSTHPEAIRDQRKKWLESERVKAVNQLAQMTANRVRLEAAVSSADALVDRLRRAVDAEDPNQNVAGNGTTETPAPDTSNASTAPADYGDNGNSSEPATVPPDAELVQAIKANLADAGITTVQVEVANGAVILTGDIPSAKVPAALRAASDAHPRRVYNQMTVR